MNGGPIVALGYAAEARARRRGTAYRKVVDDNLLVDGHVDVEHTHRQQQNERHDDVRPQTRALGGPQEREQLHDWGPRPGEGGVRIKR